MPTSDDREPGPHGLHRLDPGVSQQRLLERGRADQPRRRDEDGCRTGHLRQPAGQSGGLHLDLGAADTADHLDHASTTWVRLGRITSTAASRVALHDETPMTSPPISVVSR